MRTFIVLCTTTLCLLLSLEVHAVNMPPTTLKLFRHLDQKSGALLGTISIPKIELQDSVFEGIDQTIIDKGIAHWAGSASPGEFGNMILGAHRILTRGKIRPGPFYLLDELTVGDAIQLVSKDGETHTYFVAEKRVIHKTDVPYVTEPVLNVGESLLTLFTCHPPGKNEHRLVIRAVME